MKRLSNRERTLAVICGIVLLAAVLLQGVAKPLRARLGETNRTLEERRKVISRAQAAALDLYQMDLDVKAAAVRSQDLLLAGDAVPQMLRALGQAAKKAGINEVDLRPLPGEEMEGFTRHRVQLEFRSPFPQVKDFLYYLEEGKSALTVERVEINTSREGSDLIHSTVLVAAYSRPQGGRK